MSVGALSPSAEAAWETVRQHAEWSPGFWLGWIFTAHAPSAHALCGRLERSLADAGRSSRWWLASTPEELAQIQRWLLEGAEGTDGCAWVAVAEQTPAWRAAWEQLMSRLNERRELLRERMKGGLVFVAPPALKAATRESAPDLWSIRSWALDVEGLAAGYPAPLRSFSMPFRARPTDASAPVQLAAEAVRAAEAAGDRGGLTEALLRLSVALRAAGRSVEALASATRALEMGGRTARAVALLQRGAVQADLQQHAEAVADLQRASEELGGWIPADFAAILVESLEHLGREEEGVRLLRATLARPQEDSSPAQVDRALTFMLLGDTLVKLGRAREAQIALHSGLDLTRRLQGSEQDAPTDLAALEVLILSRLGAAARHAGDRSTALEVLRQGAKRGQSLREAARDPAERARWDDLLSGTLADLADLTPDPEEAAALRAEVAKLQASLTPESP